jgi:hypothetical protein
MRRDAMDPEDSAEFNTPEQSYFRVRSLRAMEGSLASASNDRTNEITMMSLVFAPLWEPLIVVLSPNVIFGSPRALLSHLFDIERDGIKALSSHALVISPYRHLQPQDIDLISSVFSGVVDDGACMTYESSSQIKSRIRTVRELLSECRDRVLALRCSDEDQNLADSMNRKEVIDFIGSSTTWNSLITFVSSTSGFEELCLL